MKQSELTALLGTLIDAWENEIVEFKEAGNDYKTNKIGSYFSALANEANLRGLERAWLIFGVNNKTRSVVFCWENRNQRICCPRILGRSPGNLKGLNGRMNISGCLFS